MDAAEERTAETAVDVGSAAQAALVEEINDHVVASAAADAANANAVEEELAVAVAEAGEWRDSDAGLKCTFPVRGSLVAECSSSKPKKKKKSLPRAPFADGTVVFDEAIFLPNEFTSHPNPPHPITALFHAPCSFDGGRPVAGAW